MLGKNDYDFFPKGQADFFVEKDRAVLRGREIVDIEEEQIQTSHLGVRTLHTRKIPLLGPSGEPEFLLGISEDITDRKKAEKVRLSRIREEARYREREISFRRISFLADASVLLSSSLNYREALECLADVMVPELCDGCAMILKKDESENPECFYFHVPSDLRKLVMRDESSASFPSGAALESIGVLNSLIVPIRSGERVLGSMGLFNTQASRFFEIEDRLLAEELGRRVGMTIENAFLYERAREAVHAREEFLSIASHELKTPITSLKLQLQMAQRGLRASVSNPVLLEKFPKFIEQSLSQVDRLTRLIEDLLDVSRIQAGKIRLEFKEVDVSELVPAVVERYMDPLRQADCEVALEIAPAVVAMLDADRFEQVFVNLLSNAIKYAPGKLIRIGLQQTAEELVLTVRDSGPGIATEWQDRIFNRFERAAASRNMSGLGLGLFITRQIIDFHGGKIFVESEFGKGAEFRVHLPLYR